MKDKYYIVSFGLSYPMWLAGKVKRYHRTRKYTDRKRALKCYQRANDCKWVEWTDFYTIKN